MSFLTAFGNWLVGAPQQSSRSPEPKPSRRSKEITEEDLLAFNQRKHHYTFDVDDNGLDISGFILHTDKHKGKRQKFRVYLDSNENGRFDKTDQFIGRTGLKQKHAAKGIGNLLDDDELGQLEVKFKNLKSNASMREPPEHLYPSDDVPRAISMSFTDSVNAEVKLSSSIASIKGYVDTTSDYIVDSLNAEGGI